jgi:proline-specific peptidase
MTEISREGYIEVPGGKIWYEISGADKPKVPLLVLHGGPGAPHYYLDPLKALAADRPVIFYDQLGCGNSDRPRNDPLWTMERFVEELDILRKKLALRKLHLLGQSWGTMLAVDYMLTHGPEGIVSLILSSPCLSVSRWRNDCRRLIDTMEEKDQKAILAGEETGRFDSPEYQAAMMAFYRKHLCRMDPWPECVQKTFEHLGAEVYKSMWGPSEFTITGTLKNYERSSLLKDIKVPALFTCGRYDEASPESTEYFHKEMPGSQFLVIEDASHMHHLEKTELYLNTLRAFLTV